MAKNIMIQGTGSTVGKSIITAGLCRIFLEDGHRVAPFKSQNMALNSFVTNEGLEMGRAQVLQAEACRIEPSVLMNPILIKPTSDCMAQVIVNGKVYKNLDARDYHNYKTEARAIVEKAYFDLEKDYDIIVIEGAGSPAEINLRDRDIVNMGMAGIAGSPVVLVGDIDKGGVFASIVGTLYLLSDDEKRRVRGVIINKFRGDINLLTPGLKMLEDIIKIPVLGVIPYMRINLEDEDSVTEKIGEKRSGGDLNIYVIRFPYMSNFTDFDVFNLFKDVNLNYVNSPEEIVDPDMIILPGSKNTIEDLNFLNSAGFYERIHECRRNGVLIFGICGGYQMLGKTIDDPHGTEGSARKVEGLGLVEMDTVITGEKITVQVTGKISGDSDVLKGMRGILISGYEIHIGRSSGDSEKHPFVRVGDRTDGVAVDGIIGVYIHGIFDSTEFTGKLLNNIRKKKGLPAAVYSGTFQEQKEIEFKKLSGTMRECLDMKRIYEIIDR